MTHRRPVRCCRSPTGPDPYHRLTEVDRDHLARFAALRPGDLPDLIPKRPAFFADAACKGESIDVFFPANGGSAAPGKAICATCPALDPCREWALEQGPELHGIFGGTTPNDRAKFRKVIRSTGVGGNSI